MGQISLSSSFMKSKVAVASALLIAIVFISVTASAQFGGGGSGLLRNQIDGYMIDLAKSGFSGSLLVAIGGDIVLRKGYGSADDWTDRAVGRDTVMDISSLATQFTAASILLLAERGQLSLEDPISRYLADVPSDKANVTLHQLLTHTGGFTDISGVPGSSGILDKISRDQALSQILSTPLIATPGQRYAYSESGYSTLAAIAEIVSGQSFTDFVTENIFEPARMSNTGFYGAGKWDSDDAANSYVNGEDYGSPVGWPNASWSVLGFGGVLSTVYDLYLWNYSLQNHTVLAAESVAGLFWEETTEHGLLNTNNGGNLGGSADYSLYEDQDLLIIILSNRIDIRDVPGPASEVRLFATETSRQLASNILASDFSQQPAPYYRSITSPSSSGGSMSLVLLGLLLAGLGLALILLKK